MPGPIFALGGEVSVILHDVSYQVLVLNCHKYMDIYALYENYHYNVSQFHQTFLIRYSLFET